MGSQWSLLRVDELESVKPVLVTTRARVFFCAGDDRCV